jgi:Na+/H+ antiporter NhaD/arsenite permease-like protein
LASPKFRTEDLLGLVDWPILVLFIGLFVITGAFQDSGWGDRMMQSLTRGGFHLEAPIALVLTTAGLSNLINNSAAVMLLLKVVKLSCPATAYILALANSLGGSLIITGSVSNIIVVQQAKEMGISISFREFAQLGVPVTLTALAGLLVWIAMAR